jgi:hypothetical protein
MTQLHLVPSGQPIAGAVPPDHCEPEMHDVFIVVSEGADGEHIARTVYAASEDDARQAHQDNYADEPIVAVHQ